MSRRHHQDPTGSVSLFPFLAVLISTMGSLILLLVVFMQQARTRENAEDLPTSVARTGESARDESTDSPSQADKLADLTWQIAALSESREKTLERLKNAKLKLSMAEDQTRQLHEQLDRLEKEAQQLETVRDRQLDASAAETTQLESIRAAIAATQVELATARDQASRRGPSFAIIPYKGPSGTDRRPIFVECQEERIVVQPEGIVLVATDFEEPVGPNNPLATAMRAVREHWVNTRLLDSAAHAYPLLIVRPQGAHTYAACRQALRGWDDEFGYELVPDSMELKYPPVDPSLARVLQEAIRDSRLRANLPDPNELGYIAGRGNSTSFDAAAGEYGAPLSESAPDGEPHPPVAARGSGGGGMQSSSESKQSTKSDGARTNSPSDTLDGEFVDANAAEASGTPGTVVRPPGAIAGVSPLSASHGANWALPNSAGNSIGMSRPVSIICERNRLILPPASGDRSPAEEFAFDTTVQTAIPPFVDALWRRIDSWGTAGYGAYWKPTLQVTVGPEAEETYLLFERLMENSGLQVERRFEE